MEKHKEPIGENCQNGILNCETSGTPKPNVPALRFPEFSGEWERCALAEICSIVGRIGFRGYTIQDIVEKGTGAIALSPSNITDNRLSYDKDNTYISYFKYEESPEIKVFVGDIVFVKTGSTVGKVAYVDNILCETTLNPQLVVLKNIKCNSFLLGQILSASKFQNAIKRITVGGAVPTLSQNEMGKISVSIPQKMEQEKLATLFHLIDERIATQNKIIEDLKKLKSAISKQVFAQGPNGWSRLDTLFSKGKAGGTPTSTNKEYYNGEIPFLSINDITKQGKYVRYTENHLSQSGLENSSAWVVPKYSLIMSMYASVGLVTINEIPITTSQAMFAMQLKDKDLLDYLYYYLSYFKYRHIHKYLETGTQSNINADIVRGIMIPTYGHSRNMEIASTLQSIDVKIDNELSVLKLFNRQKNYLLSQMFI